MQVRVDVRTDGPGTAEANMAEDARLLSEAVSAGAPPLLRLYGWSVPCVTYGRSQDPVELDFGGMGLPAVRRPSGGLAALHLPGDLAFCLVGSHSGGMPRTALDLFQSVLGAMAGALRSMGVEAAIGAGVPSMSERFCARASSPADILTGGGKLCGSAQRRVRGGALVHGSVSLAPLNALPGGLPDAQGSALQRLMRGGFRPSSDYEAPDASELAELFITELTAL